MNYTLLVTAPVYKMSAHIRAMEFAKRLLQVNHSIQTVFFYGPGAGIGLASKYAALTDKNPIVDWTSISKKTATKLILCVSSAMQEGILLDNVTLSLNQHSSNLAEGFEIGGIGSLIEAITKSDRLLTFGG